MHDSYLKCEHLSDVNSLLKISQVLEGVGHFFTKAFTSLNLSLGIVISAVSFLSLQLIMSSEKIVRIKTIFFMVKLILNYLPSMSFKVYSKTSSLSVSKSSKTI